MIYSHCLPVLFKGTCKNGDEGKQMVPSLEAWARVQTAPGRIFYVTFRLKHPSPDGRPAGTVRRMLAKWPVHKYKRGIVPDNVRNVEDYSHNVLTVWDVQAFKIYRKQGVPLAQAGEDAYRRINMADVIDISIPPVQGP